MVFIFFALVVNSKLLFKYKKLIKSNIKIWINIFLMEAVTIAGNTQFI